MIIYRFLAKSGTLEKIYSLLKQNVKSRNARQKSNFARVAHFFCTLLLFARLQRETSRNFLATRIIEGLLWDLNSP